MDVARFGEIALRHRAVNNPLNPRTLDQIIAVCDPPPGSRVLDVGCGKGEFLIRLAEQRAVRAEGIDLSEWAIGLAQARCLHGRMCGSVRFRHADARSLEAPREPYFLSACLGATHAFGGLRGTLTTLREWTQPSGWIVVGEGFWKQPPAAEYLEVLDASPDELLDDAGNVRAGKELGLELAQLWSSTSAEWDEFEAAYLEGIESYARERPDDPEVPEMLLRIHRWRDGYLRWGRNTLGFGVYAFRTGPADRILRREGAHAR